MGIMAILATIALPAFKGMGQSNLMAAANRQFLDDIAGARSRAIGLHTTVYLVFVPPDVTDPNKFPLLIGPLGAQMTNLFGSQFTTYAMVSLRTVGDQPGQTTPRYLTSWRSLPPGVFIAVNKFGACKASDADPVQAFPRYYVYTGPNSSAPMRFPFPSPTNSPVALPYIGFDYLGRLIPRMDDNGVPINQRRDEYIPLARGSIFYARDAANRSLP